MVKIDASEYETNWLIDSPEKEGEPNAPEEGGESDSTPTEENQSQQASKALKSALDSTFEKDEWMPYLGPDDGEGWQNANDPDDVRYVEDPPGEVAEGYEDMAEDWGENQSNENLSNEEKELKKLVSGEVNLSEIEPRSIKLISQTLANFTGNEQLPVFENIEYNEQLYEKDILATTGDGTLNISSHFNNPEEIIERRKQIREKWDGPSDRPNAGITLKDNIIHEYGHHLIQEFRQEEYPFDKSKIASEVFHGRESWWPGGEKEAKEVSYYAMSSPEEYQAESFLAYMNGEKERLNPKVESFWDTMLEKGPDGDWSVDRWT